MADPVTLALVSSTMVTEGIKFFYGQTGEILKRWRERKDAAAKDDGSQQAATEPAQVAFPDVFQGQLSPPQVHFEELERAGDALMDLYGELALYGQGIKAVDMADEATLRKVDALRRLLELVYQQRLTFKGEQRQPSGPVVKGQIDVEEVLGYAAVVRATTLAEGTVIGEGKAKRVGPGGEFVVVDVETIGGGSA